jgi:hypothetical protein
MPGADVANGDPLAEALATCRMLWPGREVAVVASGERRRSPGEREFLVVPGSGRPRLLLPAGARRAAASVVTRVNTSVGLRGRGARAVLAASVGTGLLDRWAPRRLRIAAPGGGDSPASIEDALSEIAGRRLCVTFALGTPRANSKPVLTALDEGGKAVFFAKVGHNPLTERLVMREAETLRSLAARRTATFVAPACIHDGQWRGLQLLVMDALPSSLWQGWGSRTPPFEAMREVAALEGVVEAPLGESDFFRTLCSLDGVRNGPARERLERILAGIRDQRGGDLVHFGSWHGDWTPDNMGGYRDKLYLWDWERFRSGVPLGFDGVHYCIQRARYSHGWTGVRAALRDQLPGILRTLEVSGRDADLTTLLYLADIVVRYLRDSREVAHNPLRDTIEAVMALLDVRYADLEKSRRP